MQEEIIPLVPVLLVLGRGLGVDGVVVVAMSAGAAMIGSAFGPTNPFQAAVALSVSGQAVLTMPLVEPLADLLGLSRQVPVLAYQTGAGLMELMTPTNGALMAVLVAAGVSFQRCIRFAFGAVILATLLGVLGIAAVIWLRVA
jgi:uncharacterized ion transporter superfamily protein YfcC